MNKRELTPQERRTAAFDLYLQGLTRKEISEEMGIPLGTLKEWISKYDWADLKREHEEQAYNNHARAVQAKMMTNRLAVMDKHLQVGGLLTDALHKKITQAIDGNKVDFSARDLEAMAKALKNTTDVTARVVGITDRIDPIIGTGGGGSGSAGPSFIVNIGSGPQPVETNIPDAEVIEENDRPF